MAISRVQRTAGNASFTNSLAATAFGSSNTAGNAIIAVINTSAGAADVSSVTDTKGNTYARQCAVYDASSFNSIEIWAAKNIGAQASNIVTAHDSGFNLCNLIAIEVAGLATTGTILDQFTTNKSTGGTLSVGPTTATTNANDFVLVAGSITVNSGTWTLGAGYSNLENPTTSATAFAVESKVVSATAALSGVLTESVTNQNYSIIIAAFSDTAIGGGATIAPTGRASTITIGSPTVTPGTVTIAPTGVASTAVIGTPAATSVTPIAPTGVASTATIGAPTLTPGTATISPTGKASTATIGVPTATPGVVSISPTGRASTAALGAPSLGSTVTISPSGVASVIAIGTPTLAPGAVTISPTGRTSTVQLGAPSLAGGSVTVAPAGLPSGVVIGTPTLSVAQPIVGYLAILASFSGPILHANFSHPLVAEFMGAPNVLARFSSPQLTARFSSPTLQAKFSKPSIEAKVL